MLYFKKAAGHLTLVKPNHINRLTAFYELRIGEAGHGLESPQIFERLVNEKFFAVLIWRPAPETFHFTKNQEQSLVVGMVSLLDFIGVLILVGFRDETFCFKFSALCRQAI